MSERSSLLSLPYLQPSQAQKHVTHNEALRLLDALVQLAVLEAGRTEPPPAPEPGARYILGDGTTGAWAGHDREIAIYEATGWGFLAPRSGWRAEDLGGSATLLFDGVAWRPALDRLERLGIGTDPALATPLTVAGETTLLTDAGAGHRLVLNKATALDTASLLFQTGYSGRAEIGTAGSDRFAIKLSADGTIWQEALTLDPASGLASGSAIQSGPGDDSTGRLMAVGAFGLGGSVAQTLTGNDLDAIPLRNAIGQHHGDAATLNAPFDWAGLLTLARSDTRGAQLALDTETATEPALALRTLRNDGHSPWREVCHRGNVLGPVSQSAGLPTGALIEQGSNANGRYIRFADGTQIAHDDGAALTTAPALFSGAVASLDGDKLWIGRWY